MGEVLRWSDRKGRGSIIRFFEKQGIMQPAILVWLFNIVTFELLWILVLHKNMHHISFSSPVHMRSDRLTSSVVCVNDE